MPCAIAGRTTPTRMPQTKLFELLERIVPILQPVSGHLGRIPVMGRTLKRLIPVADYTGIYPLSDQQLREWALLDTFDMLAPKYDNPHTSWKVREWLENAGLVDVEVLHEGHLVGRGCKLS